ncbi:hypothetical protein L2Y94_05500 [Luteibacter aegosomatis]|uniref:hypothetical protein n=1 Tax=Luteibacter aegosomatis TaxID=2911537 RepID=UPI001FFA9636|nr:hypothetical protein [Luteibacter aegosomatis]UPG86810.1 hypothetical protein L2Y94_05500 [Luteibacter aegosomatis]
MRPDADAKIVDGEIVIRLSLDTMVFAAEKFPGLEEYDEETDRILPPVITDREAFAKELVRLLNAESEDGSTLVTNMFDAGFLAAAEDGAKGIAFPGDEDYPESSSAEE